MAIVTVSLLAFYSLGVGLAFWKILKIKLEAVEEILASLVVGVTILSYLVYWQSWLVEFSGSNIWLTTSAVGILSWGYLLGKKFKWRKVKQGKLWLINLGFWGSWFYLVFRKMLVITEDGMYTGWVNVWGDWAAHLTYTTSFAYGDNFPTFMPILAGAKFAYPFMADFLSAMLIKLGVSLVPAMLGQGIILALVLAGLVITLAKRVSGSLKTGALTAILFMFSGGLGFWWWSGRELTHNSPANIEWINVITSQVVPQRGFLLGMPLAILIYTMLWLFKQKLEKKYLVAAGLVAGMLALVAMHTLLVVGMVAVVMTVWGGRKELKKWLWFYGLAGILSLPQIYFIYGSPAEKAGVFAWQLGWMSQGNWLWFWFKNVGVTLALALLGQRKWLLPFWLVFVAGNLVRWQNWEWDNSKLFTHWYLAICVAAAMVLGRLWVGKKWGKAARMIILVVAIVAGLVDNLRMMDYDRQKLKWFGREELGLAEWIKSETDPDDLVLTADNHDHWLPVLTGRKLLMGYKGWLWSYGIDFAKQEEAAGQIYLGEGEELIDSYGLDWVVIGPQEKRLYKVNEEWFVANANLAHQTENTKIYRLD